MTEITMSEKQLRYSWKRKSNNISDVKINIIHVSNFQDYLRIDLSPDEYLALQNMQS